MQVKTLTVFLVIALISVAVFGFLGMGVVGDVMTHTCPFSALVSGNCAILESVASLAAHHFAALQNLSGEMASFDILALVFSLLFLFALFYIHPLLSRIFSTDDYPVFRYEELTFIQKLRLLRWLAYHNKRDYLAPALVRVFAS